MRIRIALITALLLLPSLAFAWGPEGHAIIAQIAEDRLAPAARQQVDQLLDGDSLAVVASWADEIRIHRPDTAQWHFVDIPKNANDYDPARDCRPTPRGDCIIAAIDRELAILRDASADKDKRAEALKFIVHFVGDLHQPLHCADDHDRGGNDVTVKFFRRTTNCTRSGTVGSFRRRG